MTCNIKEDFEISIFSKNSNQKVIHTAMQTRLYNQLITIQFIQLLSQIFLLIEYQISQLSLICRGIRLLLTQSFFKYTTNQGL